MRTAVALLCLLTLCRSQKRTNGPNSEWDQTVEKLNAKGCVNLTLVLDNWKFAIMTQVKDLLLNDHTTVLPDYGRILPLSDALGDLYKEFSALKESLRELTSKFDRVETFVDDARAGRFRSPPRAQPYPVTTNDENHSIMRTRTEKEPGTGTRPQGRKNRVVVRRLRTSTNSVEDWGVGPEPHRQI
ncbi:hypothetical protein UPYG_G00329950 [Umbra pygmaea]|uniref:Uncharacterized protein n=1 Tax=Umbra pygmaea TaxID=75934 RepID=A0ABD0W2U6_UMBPY